MRWLLMFGLLFAEVALATEREYIKVRSADGAKAMQVAVLEIEREAGLVKIELRNGQVMTAKFSAFLPEDSVRMEEHYQFHVEASYVTRAGKKLDKPRTPELERQVSKALGWLETQAGRKGDGSFGEKFPVSMTSFALLCLSKNNEGVSSVKYGKTVRGALEYLVKTGEAGKGLMASTRDRNISYEHGIATWALAEALATDRRRRFDLRTGQAAAESRRSDYCRRADQRRRLALLLRQQRHGGSVGVDLEFVRTRIRERSATG